MLYMMMCDSSLYVCVCCGLLLFIGVCLLYVMHMCVLCADVFCFEVLIVCVDRNSVFCIMCIALCTN